MREIGVRVRDEPRRYMGPKCARVPRGAVVRLVAVVNGKMGIFEWNNERFNCPIRLLWRLENDSNLNLDIGHCEASFG